MPQPPTRYIAHAVGAFVFAAPCAIAGLWGIAHDYAFLPIGRDGRVVFAGAAAYMFGWSLIAAAVALAGNTLLTCFDRWRTAADRITKWSTAALLLLLIAAFLTHLVTSPSAFGFR